MWICECGFKTEDIIEAMEHSVSHFSDHKFHRITAKDGKVYVDGKESMSYNPFIGETSNVKIITILLGKEE